MGGRARGDDALHDYDKVLIGSDVHHIHSPNGTGGCLHHPHPLLLEQRGHLSLSGVDRIAKGSERQS